MIGLQRLIDRLADYCEKWKLTVNIEKTKIMVFRRGGSLRKAERWYYHGSQLQVVPYFKYLGVTFSTSGSWARNNTLMGERGQRALNYIRSVNFKLSSLPCKALCSMFDAMVVPSMTYGGEVWGFDECSALERVQAKFGKFVLGLPISVPNIVPCMEMGRNSIKCIVYQKIINYWIKISHMTSNRSPWKCYQLN